MSQLETLHRISFQFFSNIFSLHDYQFYTYHKLGFQYYNKDYHIYKSYRNRLRNLSFIINLIQSFKMTLLMGWPIIVLRLYTISFSHVSFHLLKLHTYSMIEYSIIPINNPPKPRIEKSSFPVIDCFNAKKCLILFCVIIYWTSRILYSYTFHLPSLYHTFFQTLQIVVGLVLPLVLHTCSNQSNQSLQ